MQVRGWDALGRRVEKMLDHNGVRQGMKLPGLGVGEGYMGMPFGKRGWCFGGGDTVGQQIVGTGWLVPKDVSVVQAR